MTVDFFDFQIPLLRGGAVDLCRAGVCLTRVYYRFEKTHPCTPLKRGIAQALTCYNHYSFPSISSK